LKEMANKRKPLSSDEKKKRVMEYFFETNDFYNLTELEKTLSKEKGIVQNSIKDILQSLVEDGMVDMDKVGGTNLYWAFPSKITKMKRQKLANLKKAVENETAKIEELENRIEKEKKLRVESDRRTEMLAQLEEAEKVEKETKHELEQYKEKDPEVINKRKRESEEFMKHAIRWTDNIFAIQQYCSSKFNLSSSEVMAQLGLPEDFDYPKEK